MNSHHWGIHVPPTGSSWSSYYGTSTSSGHVAPCGKSCSWVHCNSARRLHLSADNKSLATCRPSYHWLFSSFYALGEMRKYRKQTICFVQELTNHTPGSSGCSSNNTLRTMMHRRSKINHTSCNNVLSLLIFLLASRLHVYTIHFMPN
jgi:hypothetical protein